MYAPALRRMLFTDRQREVAQRSELYVKVKDRTDIELHQVERFNTMWRHCLQSVPFYTRWAQEHSLPRQISRPSDLRDFPLLTKRVLNERADEVFQGGVITAAYSTGGTTGTPVRYPRGEADAQSIYANTYIARAWWDVRPFDSYVHLWGHAHLFGGTPFARLRRQVADRIVNATRLNAYELTPAALESHYRALLKRNPKYLVGYTSAVCRLARHIDAQGDSPLAPSQLRAVVVTAETVTEADVELIRHVFGVPVVTEYGAAETGVIAASCQATWPLQVLWDSFVVLLGADQSIAVTTLNDRLFPLVNYSIGDLAEPGDVVAGNALTLSAVVGRSQDVVRVGTVDGGGLELSAILPVHVLKSEPGIVSVQFAQHRGDRLRIFLHADRPLALEEIAERFHAALRSDHPLYDTASVAFEQIAAPILTKAGKQALFASPPTP